MEEGLVVHHNVLVNRAISPQVVFNATQRKLRVDEEALISMPPGEGGVVSVGYFDAPAGVVTLPEEIRRLYSRYDLRPDPLAVVTDCIADPSFTDEHPVACQWDDGNGGYCALTLSCAMWAPDDQPLELDVSRFCSGWVSLWRFGGVIVGK